jgi:hypothetical protein
MSIVWWLLGLNQRERAVAVDGLSLVRVMHLVAMWDPELIEWNPAGSGPETGVSTLTSSV